MAEVQRSGAGLLDLEKELVCSICTELLYQPLTLLDCLHTFCGSCLKEWFSWQAAQTGSSRSPRFTCPSCRAAVRETRPNATVTTLLDMFLKANPDRAKPIEEREEIAQKYKPGDAVLPTSNSGRAGDSDEEDRRLLEEVRELSLRDVDGRQQARPSSSRSGQPSRHRRAASVDTNERTDDNRARRRREEERRARRQAQHQAARSAVHAGSMASTSTSSRQIEHQSSLRSLLSSSDVESMEEEILRQIIEDGLLDGIDLHDLDQAQEEELSERIAEAYRRRHLQRSNSRPPRTTATEQQRESSHQRARSQTVQTQPTATTQRDSSRHPPISRPHLLEHLSPPSGPGHQRRASDQGARRRRTSPSPANPASSSETTLRPAARSATDTTDPEGQLSYSARSRTRQSSISSARRTAESEGRPYDAWISGVRDRGAPQPLINRSASDPPTEPPRSPAFRSEHGISELPAATRNARSRPPSSRADASSSPAILYPEPSIRCDRCGKPDIQYDLYKNCSKCTGGKYNICLRCYRHGCGCLHWFGFGSTAQSNFERMTSPDSSARPVREPPHVLRSRRYKKPAETAEKAVEEGRQMTSDDPSKRLQEGMFCDICQSPADDCFWKCGQCNYGEWGFCNSCVNQGRCCTHPLLPIRRAGNDGVTSVSGNQINFSKSTGIPVSSSAVSINGDTYDILSFSTKCDICSYFIAPSSSRFHCLQCNSGDYDICTNCYLKIVACGKISKENGHNGWRRCLKGHRMIVVGFQDHEDGPHRVIVRGLVGGHALKDEHVRRRGSEHASGSTTSPELNTGDWSWKEGAEGRKKTSRVRAALANAINGSGDSPVSSPTSPHGVSSARRFPPDGGVGLVVHALWPWYPDEEAQDELLFPGGAEITEAENINDDWFWGCYAGRTGLFPGNYGRIISEIT
ncbi:hypothetical protein Plec18167_002069 [Paecilomyces lecythidis]|uniref:RING-type domain-containing protein n=1 Tax=Paecilomyces lecythidis TaxID=3004212 RepID=A0ABR3YAJ2_9EURO